MNNLSIMTLLLVWCTLGCCTENSRSTGCQASHEVKPTDSRPVVAKESGSEVAGEIGCVVVSGGVLLLDKGSENGMGKAQVVTICAVVVDKERKEIVPVATASVTPAKTTSILNLNTTSVRDEDGDLIVKEFRANPVHYAERHRLIAVAGRVSACGLVVPESDRGTVVSGGIIKE